MSQWCARITVVSPSYQAEDDEAARAWALGLVNSCIKIMESVTHDQVPDGMIEVEVIEVVGS